MRRILIILIILILSACNFKQPQEFQQTRELLGTYITIRGNYQKGKDLNIEQIISKCFDRIEEIQCQMDFRIEDSEIALLNQPDFRQFKVNDEVYEIISDAVEYSYLTRGYFDITIRPAVELWQLCASENRIPDVEELEQIKSRIGYKRIIFDAKNKLIVKEKAMKFDLGAIAKGYALGEAAKILIQSGIKNFLIDAGGDIYCRGKAKGKNYWKIGIRNPKEHNRIIETVKVSGLAVTTSGDYERFFQIQGKNYSHIINPLTALPEENVVSATVIAQSAKKADALSTALCVMNPKEGLALINSLKDTEAMIIDYSQGSLIKHYSDNFRQYQ